MTSVCCVRAFVYIAVECLSCLRVFYAYFGQFLWKLCLFLEILLPDTNTGPLRDPDTISYNLYILYRFSVHCCWCFHFMCSQFSSLLRLCLFLQCWTFIGSCCILGSWIMDHGVCVLQKNPLSQSLSIWGNIKLGWGRNSINQWPNLH